MMFLGILLVGFLGALAAPPNNRLTIIGGHNATKGEFPYHVSIQLCDYGPCLHNCGGVILTKSWILTAGHCVGEMGLFEFHVFAGLINLNDPNKQIRDIGKYIVHPKYKNEGSISDYDTALVKLSSPLELNDLVQAAVVPKEDAEVSVTNATLSGWGASRYNIPDEEDFYPDDLQTVDLPVVALKECIDLVSEEVTFPVPPYNNSAVCTGPITGGTGACYGDSGGPLAQDGAVVGLVSWGSKPCANKGSLTVYTKVSSYISWISDNIDEELKFQK